MQVLVRMKQEGKIIEPPNLKRTHPKKRVKRRRYYPKSSVYILNCNMSYINHIDKYRLCKDFTYFCKFFT
jgi:hypothetical protein